MVSPIEMTPNQRKNETLAVLEDLLMAPIDGPVLLLLEDAHWSDPTTRDASSSRERAMNGGRHMPSVRWGSITKYGDSMIER